MRQRSIARGLRLNGFAGLQHRLKAYALAADEGLYGTLDRFGTRAHDLGAAAAASARHHQPLDLQDEQGLAHGGPGQAGLKRQVPLAGQGRPDTQLPVENLLT